MKITGREAGAIIGWLLATDHGDFVGDVEESLGINLDQETQEELVIFYDDWAAERHNASDE